MNMTLTFDQISLIAIGCFAVGFACGGLAGRIMAASIVQELQAEKKTSKCLAAHIGELETLREQEANGNG